MSQRSGGDDQGIGLGGILVIVGMVVALVVSSIDGDRRCSSASSRSAGSPRGKWY